MFLTCFEFVLAVPAFLGAAKMGGGVVTRSINFGGK